MSVCYKCGCGFGQHYAGCPEGEVGDLSDSGLSAGCADKCDCGKDDCPACMMPDVETAWEKQRRRLSEAYEVAVKDIDRIVETYLESQHNAHVEHDKKRN